MKPFRSKVFHLFLLLSFWTFLLSNLLSSSLLLFLFFLSVDSLYTERKQGFAILKTPASILSLTVLNTD